MAKSLLEKYAKRLQVSEGVYARNTEGGSLTNLKKVCIATCLENTSRFLNEAFDASTATQRSDMGDFKRFCLNLTTVALPNLIAFDLVLVHPMTSLTGYIAYLEYQSGTTKGETNQDDLFASPFKLGDVDSKYTSSAVVEPVTTFTSGTTKVAFTPVIAGSIKFLDADGNNITGTTAPTAAADGTITGTSFIAGKSATDVKKIAYTYDNEIIPQEKIPTLKAVMKNKTLLAKARRIAIYYSQIAAFQAKTDYGFDLGDSLAEQAVGRLSYEIDTEIVELLDVTAGAVQADLTWSKVCPVGVSKRDHYAGFAEVLGIADQLIYDRTKKFSANYMVCASDVKPVLLMMDAFKAAPAGQVNGPYMAGTFGNLKVFVSPAMASGEYIIGVNGNDLMSSVAVYAPYMAVVPTQLLQGPDGASAQGFSTMYDLKVLNDQLVVKGQITK